MAGRRRQMSGENRCDRGQMGSVALARREGTITFGRSRSQPDSSAGDQLAPAGETHVVMLSFSVSFSLCFHGQ